MLTQKDLLPINDTSYPSLDPADSLNPQRNAVYFLKQTGNQEVYLSGMAVTHPPPPTFSSLYPRSGQMGRKLFASILNFKFPIKMPSEKHNLTICPQDRSFYLPFFSPFLLSFLLPPPFLSPFLFLYFPSFPSLPLSPEGDKNFPSLVYLGLALVLTPVSSSLHSVCPLNPSESSSGLYLLL